MREEEEGVTALDAAIMNCVSLIVVCGKTQDVAVLIEWCLLSMEKGGSYHSKLRRVGEWIQSCRGQQENEEERMGWIGLC
jgi:hypothetical protein